MFRVLKGPACHGIFGMWENHVGMGGSWKLIVKHVYSQRITEHSLKVRQSRDVFRMNNSANTKE